MSEPLDYLVNPYNERKEAEHKFNQQIKASTVQILGYEQSGHGQRDYPWYDFGGSLMEGMDVNDYWGGLASAKTNGGKTVYFQFRSPAKYDDDQNYAMIYNQVDPEGSYNRAKPEHYNILTEQLNMPWGSWNSYYMDKNPKKGSGGLPYYGLMDSTQIANTFPHLIDKTIYRDSPAANNKKDANRGG